MKKITIASCLLIVVALLITARWGTKADDAPQSNTLGVTDTTLAVALSVEDMVRQSDVIAIGNVVETRSVWSDQTLVTLATVTVTESLKGTASTLTVELPGGIDANRAVPIAMTFPGAPSLQPGDNAFLFLTATGGVAGSYNVTGFSQGKFSIITDESGEEMVSRNLTKTSLKSNNGVRRGGSDLIPLASLKQQVRDLLTQ